MISNPKWTLPFGIFSRIRIYSRFSLFQHDIKPNSLLLREDERNETSREDTFYSKTLFLFIKLVVAKYLCGSLKSVAHFYRKPG